MSDEAKEAALRWLRIQWPDDTEEQVEQRLRELAGLRWRFPLYDFGESVPEPPHLGSFGVERKHHCHEGVDLYCPEGTPVYAVERGEVVAIDPFTGPAAESPWWHDTQSVMVEGESGVVLYGEIEPAEGLCVGVEIKAEHLIGSVKRVLRKDKGRPMSMLHLELYVAGAREAVEWPAGVGRPTGLLDPTEALRGAVRARTAVRFEEWVEGGKTCRRGWTKDGEPFWLSEPPRGAVR